MHYLLLVEDANWQQKSPGSEEQNRQVIVADHKSFWKRSNPVLGGGTSILSTLNHWCLHGALEPPYSSLLLDNVPVLWTFSAFPLIISSHCMQYLYTCTSSVSPGADSNSWWWAPMHAKVVVRLIGLTGKGLTLVGAESNFFSPSALPALDSFRIQVFQSLSFTCSW